MNAAAGGWETWSWDASLFAGTAGYYEQGRLPYAPGLAEVFARSLALDGRGRLLDVGCGPGTVTLRLAPLFEAAVGLDPDAEMLARASRAAAGRGVGNAAWVRMRAEDLPAGLGTFRAVTFAASFHWMDRPRVVSAVATMLDPGGAVVQVDAPGYRAGKLAAETQQGTLPFPPPPDDALDQLRRQYLGGDKRAGRGIRNTSPGGEDQVFQDAGFLPAETVTVPDQRIAERTADDVVASVFSSSSTAPHLFGDRREDYERDMREILAQASPPGRFSVRLPDNILRIWRLPALSGASQPAHPTRSREISSLRRPENSLRTCIFPGSVPLPPQHRQLSTACGAGLGHRMGKMFLYGSDGYAEPTGDLTIGKPVSDELGNQLLTCCEIPFVDNRPVNSRFIGRGGPGHGTFADIRTKLLPEFMYDLPLATPVTDTVSEVESK